MIIYIFLKIVQILFKFCKYVFFHGDWLHLPIIQGHSFSQFPFMIKTATFHFLSFFGRKHISESSDLSSHCIVKFFFLGCILNIHTLKDYKFSSIHCLGFNSILFTGVKFSLCLLNLAMAFSLITLCLKEFLFMFHSPE